MPSFQNCSPAEGSSDPQPFACIRCWKQKKKCDKITPSCSRCSQSDIACVYSSNPPTERCGIELPISPPDDSVRVANRNEPSTSQTILTLTATLQQLSPNTIAREWRHQFIQPSSSPLGVMLTSLKENITETCTLFLNTINTWVPVIVESQFQDQLLRFQTHPDPEMTLLVLSIYLVTHTPVQINDNTTDTSLLYSTLKSLYAESISMTKPSIPIIQAGILISIFEYGQGWDQTGYLTIGTCARMGHVLDLHKTLSQRPPADATSRATFEIHRHVWWSLVILERLLAIHTFDSDRPFATKDPSFYDLLPSFQGRGSDNPLQLGKASQFDSTSSENSSKLEFPDANSYARSAQANYLLSRVINHIKCEQSPEARHAEVVYLDNTIQAFVVSVFEQANREIQMGWGHSCGAYLIANSALFALHRHNLSLQSNSSGSLNYPPASDSTSHLVLQSLVRIAVDSSRTSLSDPIVGAKCVPPFMLHILSESLKFLLRNKYDEENKGQWIEDINSLSCYLAVARCKWNIAGKYLDEITSYPNNPHNTAQLS